ncbi:molybdopterin cofactor-binding domain-containing protein [Mycobacterium sp. NPDC006124]|uniref:xanthine dehydrogenase family protein molybdopterin-binding subunit n=1 Tax=Mycobacterium sp. NPDC006124 TaxID=3156729 RepID=UPI0033A607AF
MTAVAASLPPSILANPMVDDWLRLLANGSVEVRSGKVELGQGVLTALAQIVAEELDVDLGRIAMTAATTGSSPNEGYTAGSLSVQHSGAALRMAAAEARAILLDAAVRRWGVSPDGLRVTDGVVTAPDGRSASYWELTHEDLLHEPVTGAAPTKSVTEYRVVGARVPRVDLPDKVAGRPRFAHDLALPGMVFGRVVRPPSRAAALRSVDTTATLALPGVVTVVRDGDFLAAVAEREEVVLRAAERLRADAVWDEHATLPDESDLPAFLTSAPAVETVVVDDGGGDPVPAGSNVFHEARYDRPYLAHASMGPSTATALVTGLGADALLEVWTHSQGVYLLRREMSRALDVAEERIVVRHVAGAGCYGHNGADDVALDAALLALAVPGRPVQVVWSRPDELGWAPFGPAAVVRIAAEVDREGAVLAWRHDVWGNGHVTRPGFVGTVGLLAASHREGGEPIGPAGEPPLDNGGGAARNAVPGYDFPRGRVVNHLLSVMPLRTSALRSLGAFVNVFAIESFMDELAVAAGRDPVEYRLAQLADARGRAVLEAVARRSGWARRVAGESRGHGVAYARYKNTSAYCAVVAEVEAASEIRVRRLTVAVDAGLVVNPDGAENQVEGGAIQATSWAVKERVRFDDRSVTSDTWETYPILTFSEVPLVDVELLPGNGNPSLGVGETAQGPTVAAIANAIYDAIGVRVRSLPFTADRIVAAMPD